MYRRKWLRQLWCLRLIEVASIEKSENKFYHRWSHYWKSIPEVFSTMHWHKRDVWQTIIGYWSSVVSFCIPGPCIYAICFYSNQYAAECPLHCIEHIKLHTKPCWFWHFSLSTRKPSSYNLVRHLLNNTILLLLEDEEGVLKSMLKKVLCFTHFND